MKTKLISILTIALLSGCAGDVATDDSDSAGWTDEAVTFGIDRPLPKSMTVEPGDNVVVFSDSCTGPDHGQPGEHDEGSILELACANALTREACAPAKRIGLRMHLACEEGTCEASVSVKCLVKGS